MSDIYKVSFPPDSRFLWLPAFYLIPQEILIENQLLLNFPRDPRKIDNYWADVFNSNQMEQMIMEAYAYLAWPHLGVRGHKEDYSMSDPIYQLAYGTLFWMKGLELIGYSVQNMLMLPTGYGLSFITMEEIYEIMSRAVPLAIEYWGLQPIIDCVKEMRCIEDFDTSRRSKVRIDFHRKWYHTQSKHPMTSLDTLVTKDGERHPMEFSDPSQSFEHKVESEELVERFKATISPKDMEILALRMQGYTYEGIARKLDYKTHSAVLKRMRKVGEQYRRFMNIGKQ